MNLLPVLLRELILQRVIQRSVSHDNKNLLQILYRLESLVQTPSSRIVRLVFGCILSYNKHISLRKEVKSLSLEELIRTVLIPLIVGILVELFSYWLNH